jgi:transposase-like protein
MNPDKSNKSPHQWSAEEKFTAVMQAANLTDEELGAFCRSKGVHASQLKQWRENFLASVRKGPKVDPEKKGLEKQIASLQRDLRRKERALAEASALLVLKKKAALIWGEGEEDL